MLVPSKEEDIYLSSSRIAGNGYSLHPGDLLLSVGPGFTLAKPDSHSHCVHLRHSPETLTLSIVSESTVPIFTKEVIWTL